MTDDQDDDAAWLAMMAGREAPGAKPTTRDDAAWLRAALLSYRPEPPPGGPAPVQERLPRLLARARAAGLLAPKRRPAGAAWLRRMLMLPALPRTVWSAAGAMAMVLAVVVMWRPEPEPQWKPVMRGPSVQQLHAEDPSELQRQIVASLRAAGFGVQPFERLGRHGLTVETGPGLSSGQAEALRQWGLQVPATGVSLRIEILGPEASSESSR